jgi:hypothetical protein
VPQTSWVAGVFSAKPCVRFSHFYVAGATKGADHVQ